MRFSFWMYVRVCVFVCLCTTQYYVIWTFVTRLLNEFPPSHTRSIFNEVFFLSTHSFGFSLDPFHLKTMCLFEQWQLNAMFAHLLLQHECFCKFSQCISILPYIPYIDGSMYYCYFTRSYTYIHAKYDIRYSIMYTKWVCNSPFNWI